MERKEQRKEEEKRKEAQQESALIELLLANGLQSCLMICVTTIPPPQYSSSSSTPGRGYLPFFSTSSLLAKLVSSLPVPSSPPSLLVFSASHNKTHPTPFAHSPTVPIDTQPDPSSRR
jgi:hypothetical protein